MANTTPLPSPINGATQEKSGTNTKRAWMSLITRTDYLPGILTLDYSLKRVKSAYPLVALYTDDFPDEGLAALRARDIPVQRVDRLRPLLHQDFANDLRFHETWTKLAVFGLVGYDRVVMLDSDMLVLQNMDELMGVTLDDPALMGQGGLVFGASHACVCNPLGREHYPATWVPENCAFTAQHGDPDVAQIQGPPCYAGVGMPNSGLLVVNPSMGIYDTILKALGSPKTAEYGFPDQELLGDVFAGRWLGLPYVYNGLKSLRWPKVHRKIWRDDCVKNVHYIFSPKPWDMRVDCHSDDQEPLRWWWDMNEERVKQEKAKGTGDGF